MKFWLLIISIQIAGCAIQWAPDTGKFYAQEAVVAKRCTATLQSMAPEQRLKVDPGTQRSPFTDSAQCYASGIQDVVSNLNYPYWELVGRYSSYLVQLSVNRDRGLVDTNSAVQSYRKASFEFRRLIKDEDDRRDATARREVAERLQIFAERISAIAAEQDRIRRENRPVTCVQTGVFRSTGVICQ